MRASRVWVLAGVAVLLFIGVVQGCAKGGASSFNVPALAPIVNESLPTILQSSSTTTGIALSKDQVLHNPASVLSDWSSVKPSRGRIRRSTFTPDNSPSGEIANAITFIKALFSNYYVSPNDGKGYQGYVNALVVGVDGRMSGIKQQIAGNGTRSCLSAAMQATPINRSWCHPPDVEFLGPLPSVQ